MAISVCFFLLSTARLDCLATGIKLLIGVAIYDLYWVFWSSAFFGDNVMVG